ncbi:MAG TPA: tetratricopeptide repeat protein [Gemmatimonadales bacterium]|nr:tetratricopeptide repeat protein [Gemmatimonadales bacterium]
MNLEKLKDTARKFEQKEDWRRAIEVYLKAIQQIESGQETSPDLSLYNRVGDLYLKTNDTAAAVRSYERAVDLYADQGFFNNAIALCGKILRVNPGRTQTYLKLAQLHARKNVVIEAKRNLIEFLERMNALGQLDQAFGSVKEFADQFSGSQEIRLMLVELLRASSREDEAREQLEKLAGEIEGRGERLGHRPPQERPSSRETEEAPPRPSRPAPAGLVFLDTGMDFTAAPSGMGGDASVEVPPAEGLLLPEPLGEDAVLSEGDRVEAVPGLEQTIEVELEVSGLDTDLGLERTEPGDIDFIGEPLEGVDEPVEALMDEALLDSSADDLIISPPGETIEVADVGEEVELEFMEPELDQAAAEGTEAAAPLADLPLLPVEQAGEPSVVELESLILDDPDNPDLHLQLADRLLSGEEEERGLEELELALAGYERLADWPRAGEMAERLTTLAPDVIRHHQKRVELAFRTGDRAPLLGAYLALGDALARAGATDKAMAVFGRVEEHDPGNAHARAALAVLRGESAPAAEPPPPAAPARPAAEVRPPAPAPPPPPAAPRAAASAGSFVDLGSMILDEGTTRDTRMRIDRADPKGQDEQKEFQEILEQFKRGIEQNLDSEDYEAHYDLGIAFKEMGLLDVAIAEFQKALRSPEGRLRTSEALGICFYDKGQFGISETVLRRAVETVDGGDEAKIGLLYWLGRAAEAQGKEVDAITSYERALAVDIRFMDLSDRMHRLAADRGK